MLLCLAYQYAMMYPETKRGMGAISLLENSKNELSASDKVIISRARFILKHAPEIAKLVAVGSECPSSRSRIATTPRSGFSGPWVYRAGKTRQRRRFAGLRANAG